MKSTLIVLAWNRWDLTRRCLETLRETDLTDAEVLVVDNGSIDETPERLAAIDWVKVLRLPSNLGFVRGNNAGIEAADPESDVVLLNNDLVFTQRDWLARLRACAHADPRNGVVGCRLRLPDGRLLHAGTYILPDTFWGQQLGSLEKDIGQYPGDREVEGIVFACAYLRRDVLRAIGGLGLEFQSYFEDTDFCLRARQAGFRTVVCGDVTLIHDEHGSSASQRELMEVFQKSRTVFRRKWRRELAGRYGHHVHWQSILTFPTGYSTSSGALLRALDAQGVRATYRYVYGPGTVYPPPERGSTGDYHLEAIRGRRQPLWPKVGVVYGQGDVFSRGRGRHRIGFTMLEVDRFPAEWVRQANRMDEVWVPSESSRRAFLDSGLKRPVHLIPLGVDPDYFHPGVTGYRNPSEYVFLSVFEWGERKGPAIALRAFNEAFSASEPVRLVCKIINVDPRVSIREEIRALGLRPGGGRISYVLNREFPRAELPSLYRSADCFVSPSRGEGWNLPLLEAMACGLPAIATDWGAHKDYLNDGNGYPLRIRGLVPAVTSCPYYVGARWADPDPEHLRALLREVYEHRDEAARRGARAAAEVAERWTWHASAARIVRRLEEIGA